MKGSQLAGVFLRQQVLQEAITLLDCWRQQLIGLVRPFNDATQRQHPEFPSRPVSLGKGEHQVDCLVEHIDSRTYHLGHRVGALILEYTIHSVLWEGRDLGQNRPQTKVTSGEVVPSTGESGLASHLNLH